LKVLVENRRMIFQVIRESFTNWRGSVPDDVRFSFDGGMARQTAVSAPAPDVRQVPDLPRV
jgi:hypothetical protein